MITTSRMAQLTVGLVVTLAIVSSDVRADSHEMLGAEKVLEALKKPNDAEPGANNAAEKLAQDLKAFPNEAEEHYRRAYELMPDSFGRVESHCFGCEGVFNSSLGKDTAEHVFTSLVEKTPEKPQVHYLTGYLRQNQGRLPEALEHFREAVARDPDDLNAWKKLSELSKSIQLPAKDRNAFELNMIRLDPLRRHGGGNGQNVTDLGTLWEASERAYQLIPEKAEELYPLAASAERLDKQTGNTSIMGYISYS